MIRITSLGDVYVNSTNIGNLANITFTNKKQTINGEKIFTGNVTIGNVTPSEISYLDGTAGPIQAQIDSKQPTLVSGTNIKTINSTSLLGSGNINISTPDATETVKGLVELATTAEVQAGTDTTRAVTPAGLMSSFANSKTENGYQKLPGGLIIQWGSYSIPSGTTQTIIFPTTFSVSCFSLTFGPETDSTACPNYDIITNSYFTIKLGTGNTYTGKWMAIGY